MDPLRLFPWLALLFAVLGVRDGLRKGHWRGAARTWLLLALIFACVSAWLRVMR
jgi:hypothetical protein